MSAGTIHREISKVTKQAEDGVFTSATPPGTRSGGNITQAFPRGGLGTASPSKDELMRMKQQMMDPNTGMSAFGEVSATDEDFKWLQSKRRTEEAANFDSWVGNNFHSNDAVTRAWLQEVYPEYYEEREQLMLERAKLALRIKLLLLRGPKNEKDLILMWGLETGNIELDRDWDVIGPSTTTVSGITNAAEQRRFAQGLLGHKQYKSDSERKAFANSYSNPFAPGSWNAAGGQAPAPFYGGAVPDNKRYPDFLTNAIQKYM